MSAPIVTGIVDVTLDEADVNAGFQRLFPDGVTYVDDGPGSYVVVRITGLLPGDAILSSVTGYTRYPIGGGAYLYQKAGANIAIVAPTETDCTITFMGSTTADVTTFLNGLVFSTTDDDPVETRELTLSVRDGDHEDLVGRPAWSEQAGGDNPFAAIDMSPAYNGNGLGAPAFFDFDGDGDLDLVSGNNQGMPRIFRVNGAGDFAPTAVDDDRIADFSPGPLIVPELADYDGDGDQDFFFANVMGGLVGYGNNGDGTWTQLHGAANPFAGVSAGSMNAWTARILDLDADGDLDVVGGYQDGAIHYFRNDAGTFVEQVGTDNPFAAIDIGDWASPAFLDLDADGDLDMVVGRIDGGLSAFENDGATWSELAGADNPFAALDVGDIAKPAVVDLDADGDLDLVVGHQTGFAYIENTAGPGLRFTVTINPQDDAAVANDDSFNGSETGSLVANVIGALGGGQDVDPDGPAPEVTAVNGDPALVGEWFDLAAGARLRLDADGGFTFDPDGDFAALTDATDNAANAVRYVTFTYTVLGGDTATVTIAVNGVASHGDKYLGTSASDDMVGDVWDEIFAGGDGEDDIIGAGGADSLRGEGGDDTLQGDDGDDTLVGGDGNDVLHGGAGADILKGGGGFIEAFYGGAGNDTYYVTKTLDIVYGEDTADGDDLVISSITYSLTAGVERLTLSGALAIDGTGNDLSNRMTGNGAANVLNGGNGDDTLFGAGGNDTLYGAEQDDWLEGGAGADTLDGGGGFDSLDGGAGNDVLNGGYEYDELLGGAGNDTLDGGEHDDYMAGGLGNDTYYRYGDDEIVEGVGGGTDQVFVLSGNYVLGANIENAAYFGSGAGTLTGNALANRLEGGAGTDELLGGAGADTLLGGDGHDRIHGGDGVDLIRGGAIFDALHGEAGADQIYGDDGNDFATGGAGADRLWGGDGDDWLQGEDDADSLWGEAGADWLQGAGGNDILTGADGVDTLEGGDGADKLYGGAETDTLKGGAGNDIMDGGDGNDSFYAGEGVDRMTGGAGYDRFVFENDAVRLSGSGQAGQRDTITDFSPDWDTIDLSAIDAIAGDGDDAFVVVSRFTKTAGEMVVAYNATANTTSLRLDVDGDGRLDLEILVNGHLTTERGGWVL